MNKKQVLLVVLIAIIATWLVNLFFGSWLAARVSTLPLARQLNLFNPQAPIVINNREVVRVNNSNDVVEVAQNSQSKVSSVVYFADGQMINAGGAVNWTSDGYFVSTKEVFAETGQNFAVVTGSGEVYPIEQVYADPASSLVLFKAPVQNLPVLDISNARDIRIGQQTVFLLNSLERDRAEFNTGYISRLASDVIGLTQESDLLSGLYKVGFVGQILPGQPSLDLSGRLIGVWNGEVVIPSAEIQLFVNDFIANSNQVIRPRYGFSYQMLNQVAARELNAVAGARIMAIAPNSPLANLDISPGDVIVMFNNSEITPETNFDNLLRQVDPGQSVSIKVSQDGVAQDYTFVVGRLP